MNNERSLVFTDGLALQTAPGMARLVSPDHEDISLDTDTIGMMSEWLATAWWNLTGEEYDPEYVGVEVDADEFDALVELERDCE